MGREWDFGLEWPPLGYEGGTSLGKGHVPSAPVAALGRFFLPFLLQGAGGKGTRRLC